VRVLAQGAAVRCWGGAGFCCRWTGRTIRPCRVPLWWLVATVRW